MMTLIPLRRDVSTVLNQVVRHGGVDVRGAGDVDDDDLRVMGAAAAHQLLGQLVGPGLSRTPMIGRTRSCSRTASTGVDSSRRVVCCWRITRSRSSTKLTATVLVIPFAVSS